MALYLSKPATDMSSGNTQTPRADQAVCPKRHFFIAATHDRRRVYQGKHRVGSIAKELAIVVIRVFARYAFEVGIKRNSRVSCARRYPRERFRAATMFGSSVRKAMRRCPALIRPVTNAHWQASSSGMIAGVPASSKQFTSRTGQVALLVSRMTSLWKSAA